MKCSELPDIDLYEWLDRRETFHHTYNFVS